MTRLSHRLIVTLLIFLCIATRIPQLVSEKLLLDGDECVVAIMAKHIAQGKDLPFYFYGQQYGFSFVECLFIIPFYWLFGVTAVAVKLGMLTLWTIGVVVLYRFLRKISTAPPSYSLLITVLFICAPAWAVWSMKARGGYLTSFTASAILLALLFRNDKKTVHYIAGGVLFALICESQQLWLPGLLPFILYSFTEKKPAHYLSFLISAAAILTPLYFYKHTLPTFGTMPMYLPTTVDILPRLQHVPLMAYAALHGNYYFDELQKPNLFCAASAIIFATAIVLILLVAFYNIITRRKGWTLFNCSALSILFTLSLTFFTLSKQARYYLPLTGFTAISLMLLLNKVSNPKAARVAINTAITIGFVAVLTFYDFEYTTFKHKKLEETLRYLENKGITHVFCSDNIFTWQILFYSNECVIAREIRPPGRYPEYLAKVNAAFKQGAPVAYVTYPLDKAIPFANPVFVNDFFIVMNPPADIINREFQIPR